MLRITLAIIHYNMENDTISRQRRGIISAIYNFVFGPAENKDGKQLEDNVTILMQNQHFQQSITASNSQANNITYIHLTKEGA